MKRLKVVVIDEAVPLPANTGKRIRTFNLLRGMAKRHDVTFLAFGDEDEAEGLRSSGIRCKVVSRFHNAMGMSLLARISASLLTPYPYSVVKHHHREFQEALDAELSHGCDLVHVEWTPYARYATKDAKVVIGSHNIETDIWRRRADVASSVIAKRFFRGQAVRMHNFERGAFHRADIVTVVSESDESQARALGAKHTKVVPNAVNPGEFAFSRQPVPAKFIFLGSLDWYPNEDAVKFLLRDILPRVKLPYTLDVVGRNPSEQLRRALAANRSVQLHADVADVRPYLRAASAMLVPLRIGGGSRIKILESLASALPVISTTVGAEGLDLQDGKEILLRDDVERFVAAMEEVIQHPQMLNALGAAGRERVIAEYTWDRSVEKLDEAWQEAVAR